MKARKDLSLLIVEDEGLVGAGLLRAMKKEWKAVTLARSSSEGVFEASTGNYDVVLSDLDCPVFDSGFEVVDASIKAGIPVALYTARSNVEAEVKVLGKPMSTEDICEALMKVVECWIKIA